MTFGENPLTPLRPDDAFKFSFSGLERRQLRGQVGDRLVDSAQFGLGFSRRQVVGTERLSNIRLELVSQNPEIGVAPHCPVSEFKLARLDAADDELAGNPVFLLGRQIAEGCALAVPFAVFCHG
jgi:hypothetical protein